MSEQQIEEVLVSQQAKQEGMKEEISKLKDKIQKANDHIQRTRETIQAQREMIDQAKTLTDQAQTLVSEVGQMREQMIQTNMTSNIQILPTQPQLVAEQVAQPQIE